MIDLSNVTFIIPLRIESDDRLRNIILSTSFLLNNFDCKVLIKESDENANFGTFAYPQIQKIAPTENLEFHHENSATDYFHRTRLLNENSSYSGAEEIPEFKFFKFLVTVFASLPMQETIPRPVITTLFIFIYY